MILTIASSKGGVGKSTTSALLAQAAARHPFPTVLIDVDPRQLAGLTYLLPDVVIRQNGVTAAEQLVALDRPDQLTIIDTPGGIVPQSIAAVEAADVLIGVTAPSTQEIGGLAEIAQALGSTDAIDLVAVTDFDIRINHCVAALQLAQQTWGAARVVVFPNRRSECQQAWDEHRAPKDRVLTLAADDLLARALDLPQAEQLRKMISNG